ncbi:MAG TPA: tetratricopeptide repeat protein [Burkholderiales bacterium]
MPAAQTPDAQFTQALELHRRGDLAAAAALYEAILAADPRHFDALHLLGMVAAQRDDPARAVVLIDRALQVDAAPAAAHHHRALALRDLGRLQEALDGFAATLARAPDHADAWLCQAEAEQALGRADAALQSYGRAVDLAPDRGDVLFARGVLLLNLQRHEAALADYDRVLALQPDFAGAINNRGLVLHALQRHQEALADFDRLVALAPAHAPAHHARGLALAALGDHADALAAHDRALTLQPNLHEALLARVRALAALGRNEEALGACGHLLSIAPAHAEGLFEQGNLLRALHHDAEAAAAYERACVLRPDFAEARAAQAMALLDQGDAKQALVQVDRALALKPDLAAARHNRGVILERLGRYDEAAAAYEEALTAAPDDAGSRAAHAHALEQLGRLPEALADLDHALGLAPRDARLHYARGAVLQRMRRHEEAITCYDRALVLEPGHVAALANRASAFTALRLYGAAAPAYAALLRQAPDYPYAPGNHLHSCLRVADWSAWPQAAQVCAQIMAGKAADSPFQLFAVSDSAALQRQCAQQHVAREYPTMPAVWTGRRYAHRRIRVAYVSGDLGVHPVSYLMAELLETHDRARFEVNAISLRPQGDSAFERRMRGAFEHFDDASSLDDAGIAQLLCARETDIAIDLMGYTSMDRTGIYMRRAAPVQAAYLGYAGTLGTRCMDYLIADPVVIPTGHAMHYDEQLVRLPGTFMPRDATVLPAPPPGRAAAGLPEQAFVFCCFNNAYKLNPPLFDLWMRLLAQVPGSVLWLSSHGEEVQARLRREAAQRGIDPARLVFAALAPRSEDHLARIALADLFLDTFPYNAHTTASDALWAGVPLLTRAGEAFASRVAASLLTAAGLPELITADLRQYEALALRLAAAPQRLAQMREHLLRRRRAGELFPTARLRGHLEQAYLRMHERSQRGLAPAAFSVPD